MRLPPAAVSIVLVLALAGPAAASLRDKKTLVVEGRTIDAEGFPIGRVRLRVQGPRHGAVTSNRDGQFTLKIPIGTPADLKRAPLRLAVAAERRGYRFTVASGDRKLAFELGLEEASGGLGRCVARSNDERVAASAARIVALEGDVVGLVVVNFLGAKGEESPSDVWPKLPSVAQVALSFPLQGPVAALEDESDAPDSSAASAASRRRYSWSILKDGSGARREEAPRGEDREKKKSRRPSEAERAFDETRSVAESTEAGSAMARSAPADSSIERWRDAKWRPPDKESPLPDRSPRDRSVRSPLPDRKSPPRDREKAAPSSDLASDRAMADRTLAPLPSPTPTPTQAPSGPRIYPEPPLASSRARARPLVIRNPPPESRLRPDSCECHVEGTVEVRSVVPLKNPLLVELSLQWYPELRDTVELFMGPPRPFKLPIAPCGPQRLRLRVLSGGHFDVASREAMAGVRCEGGRVFEPHVVLVSR